MDYDMAPTEPVRREPPPPRSGDNRRPPRLERGTIALSPVVRERVLRSSDLPHTGSQLLRVSLRRYGERVRSGLRDREPVRVRRGIRHEFRLEPADWDEIDEIARTRGWVRSGAARLLLELYLEEHDRSATIERASTAGRLSDRPHGGRWFEELMPGQIIAHRLRRTVTEADNVMFTTMTMNPAALHLDFDYAEHETQFGKPLVNSMFTAALVVGISVHETTHGTTVANLGFEQMDFPAPVFHGDTLRVESEVISARPSSSNPTQGIVLFEHRAFNQRDELVAVMRRNALMHRKPAA